MTASHRSVRANIPAQGRSLNGAGLLLAAIVVTIPTAAFAAEGAASVNSEAIFIAELGLLLLVGRLMGEAAQRLGQPAVMGQLIGGLLLGPSVLGLIWPAAQYALFPGTPEQKSMINAVSQLCVQARLRSRRARRPGETLFFGDTAASVLERSDTSNLFVAS